MLQWQHGQYTLHADGSLTLAPLMIDGRQLFSNPCKYDKSVYTRYNQTELYKVCFPPPLLRPHPPLTGGCTKRYEIITDKNHDKKRLNLYKHDGAPMNPMYLKYTPPQMLPTTTLSPLPTGTAAGGKGKLRKRDFLPKTLKKAEDINADRIWWVGVGLTGLGLVGCLWV